MFKYRYVSNLLTAIPAASLLICSCAQQEDNGNSYRISSIYSVEQIVNRKNQSLSGNVSVRGMLETGARGEYFLTGEGGSVIVLIFSGEGVREASMFKCVGHSTVVTGRLQSKSEIDVRYVDLNDVNVTDEHCYLDIE